MRKRCNSAKYTTARVIGEMIGIVGRVLKSFLFNILVFALGVGTGYSYVATTVHYHAAQCSHMNYIKQIHTKIDELAAFDTAYSQKQNEIREVLNCLSDKLAHDDYCECSNAVGKILINKD